MATLGGVKLTRENGYINSYDVWRKHPAHPAMISTGPDRGAAWVLHLPGPCEVRIMHDWSSHLCGRPAVGEVRRYGRQVPGCKMHVGVEERNRQRDHERHEAARVRQAERDHERELTRASAEWARRLADEFGVQGEGIRCGERLLVGVQPEALYARLVDLHGLLRDAGIDPSEESPMR